MGNSKRISKNRQTLAHQIKKLAEKDIHAAILLAKRGRQFTEIETILTGYYWTLDGFQKSNSGKSSSLMEAIKDSLNWPKERIAEHRRAFKLWYENEASKLFRFFIRAVNNQDSKTIIEIGKSIESLKKFNKNSDRFRHEILELKDLLERIGQKLPIRDVAQFIGWPDKIGSDGFKTLRRMCQELNFPIAELRHKANKPKTNA